MDFGLHHGTSTLNDDEDYNDEDDNLHRRPRNFCYDADASNDSTEHNLSSSHDESDHPHHSHHHHQDRRRFNPMRHLNHPPRHNHTHPNAISSSSVSSASASTCANVVSKAKSLHSSSSSSSASSMEVVSTDSHQRGFGEAAARGAQTTSNAPFVPIFEETVFLESPSAHPLLPSISTSSPISGDSWMNYSSNSSDDYTSLSTAVRNSISLAADSSHDSHSDDDHSDHSMSTEPITPQKIKRNFEHLVIDHENNSDGSCAGSAGTNGVGVRAKALSEQSLCADGSETVITKRHRGKDNVSSKLLGPTSSAVPIVGKRRSSAKVDGKTSTNSSRRNSSAVVSNSNGVDIRMIDFAHTAFVHQSRDTVGGGLLSTEASTVHHQGPDNGFLRGLDSLKRLLIEICDEGH